jgi:hypothetical protein
LSNELERMWKEAVIAWFEGLSFSCLEGLRKTVKVAVPAEILIRAPPKHKSEVLPLASACLEPCIWCSAKARANKCYILIKYDDAIITSEFGT